MSALRIVRDDPLLRITIARPERRNAFDAALIAELKEVVRENASERGWGLVGPPEITFETDPGLKKGEFRCKASLVEGEEKVEPVPASAASLVVHEDGESRSVVLASDVVTIGRLPECQVTISDKGASRRHAQVRHANGTYILTDLGSTNGTYLNEELVSGPQPLHRGDRVRIGDSEFTFLDR